MTTNKFTEIEISQAHTIDVLVKQLSEYQSAVHYAKALINNGLDAVAGRETRGEEIAEEFMCRAFNRLASIDMIVG